METLESRTKVCAVKVRVERQRVFSEEETRCKNCSGDDTSCPRYIEIRRTQIPFRKGKYALSYFDIYGDI